MEWNIRDSRPADKVLHPTTEAALLAMQRLSGREFGTILDMGCGSGLLTLAARQLWPQARLTAADVSPQAVADCTENLAANRVEAQVMRAEGYAGVGGAYDLILANLLAEIHIREARGVKEALAAGGVAVLSGILAWRLPQVAEALAALDIEIVEEIAVKDWRAVVVGVQASGFGLQEKAYPEP